MEKDNFGICEKKKVVYIICCCAIAKTIGRFLVAIPHTSNAINLKSHSHQNESNFRWLFSIRFICLEHNRVYLHRGMTRIFNGCKYQWLLAHVKRPLLLNCTLAYTYTRIYYQRGYLCICMYKSMPKAFASSTSYERSVTHRETETERERCGLTKHMDKLVFECMRTSVFEIKLRAPHAVHIPNPESDIRKCVSVSVPLHYRTRCDFPIQCQNEKKIFAISGLICVAKVWNVLAIGNVLMSTVLKLKTGSAGREMCEGSYHSIKCSII